MSKHKPRSKRSNSRNENVVEIDKQREREFTPKKARKKDVQIIPRNTAQEDYVLNLEDESKKIIFAVGPAGTGKTYMGALLAVRELLAGNIERVVITRPAVGTDGEKHGFLPGDINSKMEPWLMPILDVFNDYFTPDQVKAMMADRVIEIIPIAFMRGRSLSNCLILADEFQNTTESQAKCVLTRIGEGSRLIVTGDLNQSDFTKKNGLLDFTQRLTDTGSDMVAVCKFDKSHVERSEIVSEVLRVYGED